MPGLELTSYIKQVAFIVFPAIILLMGAMVPIYSLHQYKSGLDRFRKNDSISRTKSFVSADSFVASVAGFGYLLHYIAPVLLATTVSFVGSFLVFYGVDDPGKIPLLGWGIISGNDLSNYGAYAQVTIITMAMAFLGSYINAVQLILRRIVVRDVDPTLFYDICITMILSVILAAVVRHGFGISSEFAPQLSTGLGIDGKDGQNNPALLAVVGFAIGLFPSYFYEKFRKYFVRTPDYSALQAPPRPLEMIGGLPVIATFRLKELGIEDAYSLAKANPVSLYIKTPYLLFQTIDWVAQAQLCVILGEKMNAGRAEGLTNILTFYNIVKSLSSRGADDCQKKIEEAISMTFSQLGYILTTLESEPEFLQLKELSEILGKPQPLEAGITKAPEPERQQAPEIHQASAPAPDPVSKVTPAPAVVATADPPATEAAPGPAAEAAPGPTVTDQPAAAPKPEP